MFLFLLTAEESDFHMKQIKYSNRSINSSTKEQKTKNVKNEF